MRARALGGAGRGAQSRIDHWVRGCEGSRSEPCVRQGGADVSCAQYTVGLWRGRPGRRSRARAESEVPTSIILPDLDPHTQAHAPTFTPTECAEQTSIDHSLDCVPLNHIHSLSSSLSPLSRCAGRMRCTSDA